MKNYIIEYKLNGRTDGIIRGAKAKNDCDLEKKVYEDIKDNLLNDPDFDGYYYTEVKFTKEVEDIVTDNWVGRDCITEGK